MTQEDVIRMALSCQLLDTSNRDGLYAQGLEEFAKLVAEHEREACAKVAEEWLGPSKDREIHIAKALRARQIKENT